MPGIKELLLATVMLPLPLLLWFAGEKAGTRWSQRIWLCGVALLMGVGLLKSGVAFVRNAQSPPLWDFPCYWIYGRTIAEGRNPYDPTELSRTALPLETTEEFRRELLFFYPPPALFLLAPLGWTDIRTACQAWQWLNLGFFVLNVWLLVRFANSLEPRGGYWIVGLLLLTLRGTAETFVFTQVNFILLAAWLLYWQFRDRGTGGAALAAGILTKPFLAFAPLEMILAGRLRAMAGGLATGLVLWEQAFIGFTLLWLAFALITPPTNSLAPGEK